MADRLRSFVALPLAVVTAFLVTSCAGQEPVEEVALATETEAPDEPPPAPTFVVIHRNTPIRLLPDEDAPFVQYRPPERQTELESKWAEEERQRLEKEKERAEKRREREVERRKKIRKRSRKYSRKRRQELAEREKIRAERLRYERAAQEIRDIRRRTKKRLAEVEDRWWIPFQIVERRSSWIGIRPVGRDAQPPHCFRSNFGPFDRLEATYWVREEDLADVVTRRTRVAVWEGTEVKLLPGVVVRELERSEGEEPPLYRVFVNGFVLDLPIPEDSIGREYRPVTPFEAPVTDTVFTDIAFTEERLKLARSTPFPYNPFAHLYVTGTLRVDRKFFVTTQTPCGEYTVRGQEDLLQSAGRRGPTRLTADSTRVDPPFARGGSTAYLTNGDEFGRVRMDFPLGAEEGEAHGRPCWRTAVWGDNDSAVTRSIVLCFAESDVTREAE